MSLCFVLIGHRGSVTKVGNVDKKSLRATADPRPRLRTLPKNKGVLAPSPLSSRRLGLTLTLSERVPGCLDVQGVSCFVVGVHKSSTSVEM